LTTNIPDANINDEEAGIQVYPNPVVDILNINLRNITTALLTIEILTIYGKVLVSKKFNGHSETCQIYVSALKKGIYLCRIIGLSTIQTLRFIKQ